MSEVSPLVQEVLEGGNRGLQLLAARGLLPIPPAELVPLQVRLVGSEDPEIGAAAHAALAAIPVATLVPHLAEEATPETLAHFAQPGSDSRVLEAILRRRDVPRELLLELAPTLSPELQESLLLRQDAILELPAILEALERNPRLSLYARRRVLEYREHLLPHERAAVEVEAEAEPDPELDAALAEVRKLPKAGEVDETTNLSEGQIRALMIPMRLKLARRASRGLRSILIRDTSTEVALTVVKSNPLSEQEVEQIAGNRAVASEVLEFISRKNDWVKKYSIRYALVLNPRTPPGIAVRMLSQLSVKDLRLLAKDRNVADAVRSQAARLYRIKAV